MHNVNRMKHGLIILTCVAALAACADRKADSNGAASNLAPPATDGKPVGSTGGTPSTEPPRPNDGSVTAAPKPAVTDPVPAAVTETAVREMTVPTGTILALQLDSAVGSDTSRVEDPVRATLRRAITVDGVRVLPAGTVLTGHVTDAARSARVKGRGRVAFRFNAIDVPGQGGRVAIRTNTIARVAPGTKKRDAAKIGVGAAGGAIVGGILGGGDGAAKGAAIGGGAGTAVVLSTRGKEVRLPAGTSISAKLAAPLTVNVRG